ncbi:hypothetical protein [Undibacterium sp. Tian12W]|uniref:hypothetical protein n=1 Tax=Undibacterium sp. Tian12W TaxID=3413054 RepID=UPI003BF3A472
MRLHLLASDMAWSQINKAVMNLLLQNNGADNTPLLWFDELNKTLFLPLFCTGKQKNLFHYRTNQAKADSRNPNLHSPCLSTLSLSTATTFFQATRRRFAKKANRIVARLFNRDLAGFINDKQTSNQKSRLVQACIKSIQSHALLASCTFLCAIAALAKEINKG